MQQSSYFVKKQVPFSVAIRNAEHTHTWFPEHLRMETAKNELGQRHKEEFKS